MNNTEPTVTLSNLSMSRRKLFFRSTAIGFSAGAVVLCGNKKAAAWTNDSVSTDSTFADIEQQLSDIFPSKDVTALSEQIRTFLTSSAVTGLVSNTLATNTALTSFQRDLLQAFLDMTQYPDELKSATIRALSGKAITPSGAQLIRLLNAHPSVHVARAAGAQLKMSSDLSAKVAAFANAIQSPL